MTYAVGIPKFSGDKVLPVEAFEFSKFHENEAKHLTVTFKIKKSKHCWKNWLKILKVHFVCG